MTRIVTETATVYRVPGERRFLTKASAYRRLAKAKVKARYHEDFGDEFGNERWDSWLDDEYEARLIARLARYLAWLDRVES